MENNGNVKTEKIYRKKLTNGGAGLCILTFIAFLLSLGAALTEVTASLVYNALFGRGTMGFFANNFTEFVELYENAIIMTVFCFIMFAVAASSVRKKRLSKEYPALAVCIPILLAVQPVIEIIKIIDSGSVANAFKVGSDSYRMRELSNLGIYVLPVIAAFLMLIAGLVVMGRFSCEEFEVRVPAVKKQKNVQAEPAVQNTSYQYAPIEEKPQSNTSQGIIPDSAEPAAVQTPFIAEPEKLNVQADDNSEFERHVKHGGAEAVNAEIEFEDTNDTEETVPTENHEETEENKCKSCGEPIEQGVKFCVHCGAKQ